MTNKKKLFAPLLIAAGCFLAACSSDEIIARPSWIDFKIIDNVDTKDNTMKVIYDAIKALGDTNSNVLNKLLYEIGKQKIGDYETELSKFVNLDKPNDDFKIFVNDHSYYQTTNTLAVKLNGDKKETHEMSEDEKYEVSLAMVKHQANEIREDIAHKLYDEINGGSYSEDNLFYESRYIQNLRKDMQDVPSLEEIKAKGISLHDGVLITPQDVKDDGEMISWSDLVSKFLCVNDGIYNNYIKDKLMQDIYHNYLIQTYVRDQRYSSLGRTYARKVKMITVPAGESTTHVNTLSMLKDFAKQYITGGSTEGNYRFDYIEKAMRGIVGSNGKAYDLLNNNGFDTIKVGENEDHVLTWHFHELEGSSYSKPAPTIVFEGTKLGDLIKKVKDVYDITQTGTEEPVLNFKKDAKMDVYNELTGNGAYSIEHGLALKEIEILNTTYVKEGWYLKNGGLSDLDSTIRDRLFNISVSDIVDDPTAPYESTDYVKYFTINGQKKAFLTSNNPGQEGDDSGLVVLEGGSNYCIIEIEDAVSTSKLSTEDNENSYRYLKATSDALASAKAMNEIVYNTVKEVASGDTYKKNAEQYYLVMSNIIFYDEDVYNYFKSQYPDLFK